VPWDKALIGTYSGLPFTSPARSWPTWQVDRRRGYVDLGAESAAGPPASSARWPRPRQRGGPGQGLGGTLSLLRAGRAQARAAALGRGGAPDLSAELCSTSTPRRDSPLRQQDAAQPGSTPMAFTLSTASGRPDVSSGEALAGCCGRATPAPTLAPTTSRVGHGDRSLPPEARPGPEAGPGCWPGLTPPVLRTPLLLPAGKKGVGSASASPPTRTCGWRSPVPETSGSQP